MTDTVTVGHQIAYSIQEVDTNGQPMLTPVPFDSPPTWSDIPASPPVDTFTPSADGTTALLVATAPGTDSVTVTCIIGGVTFTATDQVAIVAAPQTLGGVQLVAVVT